MPEVYLRAQTNATISTVTFGGPAVATKGFKKIFDTMISSKSFNFRNPDRDIVSGNMVSKASEILLRHMICLKISSPAYKLANLKHVDGFDFHPSKATREKIIKESTTEIEFLDQYEPTFSILSRSDKMARENFLGWLGKIAKKVINKVGDSVGDFVVEIKNIVGIVTICIESVIYFDENSVYMTLLLNE